VLVSVGRHPASGRARRADLDARAVELALSLLEPEGVHLVHAGDGAEPALRDYLGMGLPRLTVLVVPPDADPVPALAAYLRTLKPDLVFAGAAAERGESSGLVPYLVAERLGCPTIPEIVGAEIGENRTLLLQALPRGRRRRLVAPLPLVATVARAAPMARQSAYGPARRGEIVTIASVAPRDVERLGWSERPARRRPKRLRIAAGGSAAERLRAATELQAGRGQVMIDPDPDEAAEAIHAYLVEEGILRPSEPER
jgi:electron transfer flavoprotein beta subunit